MATPSRRRLVSCAVAAMTASALTACGDETAELQGYVQAPLLDVADVSFPGADGEVPMVAEDGELLIIYFGFSSCPDVCPTTLADVGRAIDELDDDDAARVSVGMVTVDPDRDSLEVLTTYLGHYVDDPIALRESDPGALLRDAERFGITYRVEPHEPTDVDYAVEHTSQVFVIDDTGAVRVQWPFEFARSAMASDLDLLLDEIPTADG
ncbi:MAG: SCO family protein [Desertimonas sp.]